MYLILGLILGVLIGYFLGWGFAHKTVATECERLGSFYVDNKTFKCTQIEIVRPNAPSAPRPSE